MDQLRPFIFKNNTLRKLSLLYSTETRNLIDLLHLRNQPHSLELSSFFFFCIRRSDLEKHLTIKKIAIKHFLKTF